MIIPWRLKEALRPAALAVGIFAFRHGFRSAQTFEWLRKGWGNEGWTADTTYLKTICRWASQVQGPILECGSGLSTILLGIVAPGRVTTLAHLPKWQERTQQTAKRYSLDVNILSAPLVDYGGFTWYSLSDSLSRNYALVICDGPPSDTPGGRYGLLPAARRLLAQNGVILMDDVERPDEQATIARWKSELGVLCEEHRTSSGVYAIVRVKAQT